MANIATIGIKLVAYTDDLQRQLLAVDRTIATLGRRTYLSRLTASFGQVALGAYQLAEPFMQLGRAVPGALRGIGYALGMLALRTVTFSQAWGLLTTALAHPFRQVTSWSGVLTGFGNILVGTVRATSLLAAGFLGLGAAAVGASYGLVRLYTWLSSDMLAVKRMAREFDIAYDSMRLILEMGRRSGIPDVRVERWLSHLEDALGGVVNGSYEALRMFRLIGVDGKAMANMGIDDAFDSLVAHIRALPTQYERARVAAQIVGRDFRALLRIVENPMTMDTGKLRKELGQVGVLMRAEQIAVVERAANQAARLHNAVEGLVNALLVNLGPAMEFITLKFTEWVTGIGKVDDAFSNLGKNVLTWSRGIVNTIATVMDVMKDLQEIAHPPRRVGATPILWGQFEIGGTAPPPRLRYVDQWREQFDRLETSVLTATQGIRDAAREMARMEELRRVGRSPVGAATAVGMAISGNPFGLAATSLTTITATLPHLAGRFNDLLDKAGRFKDMPLLDKFLDDMRAIEQLLRENMLSPDEAGRAQARILSELDSQLGAYKSHAPGPLRVESEAAGSAIAQVFNKQDFMDPMTRVARLMEEARYRDIEMLNYARAIRDALRVATPRFTP